MIRSSTKICYLTFGRLHDRNEELSLANVANLIQTNKQAIYYIFYLQGGLCGVLRRTLQHDSAHDTNEDYRSDTVCKVSQCAPELQPNHPFDIRPTSQGKGQIKVNRTPRQAMYIDAHTFSYLFILPFHVKCLCNTFQVKHRIWVPLAYTAFPTTPASSQLARYPASCSLGKVRPMFFFPQNHPIFVGFSMINHI